MPLDELIVTLVAVGAIGASISFWGYALARITRGQGLLPVEPRRPVPWSLADLVLAAMAFVLFNLVAQIILRDVWKIELPDDLRSLDPKHIGLAQLAFVSATFATIIFAAILVIARTGATLTDLGLPLARWAYDLSLGLIGFLALAAPVYGLQALLVYFFPIQHPLIDLIEDRPDAGVFLMVGVSVSLVAPLSEEFFFRVLLQGWLEKVVALAAPGAFPETSHDALPAGETEGASPVSRAEADSENPYAAPHTATGEKKAEAPLDYRAARAVPIVISALIFALMHVGQGPAPIPLFFLALGLGYLYQRTHRIWPSLILHFVLNSASLALLWVQVK
jgi:membrane protease YdiL (CAAX protease family)